MRWLVLLSLGGALSGCGRAPEPPPPGDGSLVLGTIGATGTFAPLVDGEDATLVEGAQGGFHVWMKFRARDVPPGDVTVLRTAHRLTDDKLVLRTMGVQPMGAPGPDGFWEVPAPLPMFMCPSPIGLSVIDQPIVFEIKLQGSNGARLAGGEVTLVPRCPEASRAFCERICTG